MAYPYLNFGLNSWQRSSTEKRVTSASILFSKFMTVKNEGNADAAAVPAD
jgi:hypothetical protein